MTYLKTLPTLTVKQQAKAITELVSKFLGDLGFEDQGSDYGQDHLFSNGGGENLTYMSGYFGANSEPQIFGNWYNGDTVSDEAQEAEKQVTVYLQEIKKSILTK